MSRRIRRTYQVGTLLLVGSVLPGCGHLQRKTEAEYLERGSKWMTAKDFPRALLEFKNAARLAPQDGEPYYRIGMADLGSGDYAAAIEAFRRCLDLNPQHPGARLKTAELMTSSANPTTLANAASELRKLVDESPQNLAASDALAITEWRLGNRNDAMERLEGVLRDFPSSMASSVLLARMRLTQNDLTGAEEVLKKAAADAPQCSEAALALGEMYLLSGQISKAEPEILRAVQLNPKNPQALLALAAVQTSNRSWDSAEITYRELSALPGKQFKPLHALFLFQLGKRDLALSELQQLTRRDPADRAARTRLVAAYLETGRSADARQLLASALRSNPRDTDALLQRSALHLRDGNIADAQRDLEQVLQYHPDDPEAHRVLARTYQAQGQSQNERRELDQTLRLRRDLLAARLQLARNYLNGNEPKASVQILDEAPAAQRNLPPVVVERNWALLAMNEIAPLRSSLNEALQAGRDPDLVLQMALLQYIDRDYAAAQAGAEEVLKTNPQDVRAARIVAESLTAQKRPGLALERLTEIAKSAPGSPGIQHLLALWQLAGGNLTAARMQFEAALHADSGFTAAQLALASIDQHQNLPEAARKRLEAVMARDPSNVGAMLGLADIEKAAGNHAAAIARYRAVLAVDSNNLLALNNISIELAADSPDEALAFAQRAMEISPENPAVEDTVGWIYYRKGVYRTAAKYLKAAVAAAPNPKRQFHLGLSYLKTGEERLGQQLVLAAIRQDPSLGAAPR